MYITYIDQGNFNLIVSAQTDNTFQLPASSTIEIFDSNIFVLILEALAERKTVRFHKEIETLTTNNLIISDENDLVKSSYIYNLYAVAAKIFAKIPQYTYFRYTYLNNMFCNKGYFITEENREEVYIKILETENDELISKLEEYLKTMDLLNQHEQIYQAFVNGLNEMEMTDDEDTLNQILKEAINFFKSAEKNYIKLNNDGWFSTISGKRQNVHNV